MLNSHRHYVIVNNRTLNSSRVGVHVDMELVGFPLEKAYRFHGREFAETWTWPPFVISRGRVQCPSSGETVDPYGRNSQVGPPDVRFREQTVTSSPLRYASSHSPNVIS